MATASKLPYEVGLNALQGAPGGEGVDGEGVDGEVVDCGCVANEESGNISPCK